VLFETLDDTFNTIITREINEINDLFGMIINPGLINFYRNYISFFGEQGVGRNYGINKCNPSLIVYFSLHILI
jgi:hypothetical protein